MNDVGRKIITPNTNTWVTRGMGVRDRPWREDGMLCAYQFACNDDCVCVCPFFCGIPTALCGVCLPQCERAGNSWVQRDKNGFKTGEMLLVGSFVYTVHVPKKEKKETKTKQKPASYAEQ